MESVLPTPPGLDIQGVIYSYRIRKEDGSYAIVTLQNERVDGGGYIFRQQDEWMPGSRDGTQLNRIVPINPGIPRELWGPGSIDVEGGNIESPRVLYQYRVDPCFDPQFSPACPGYVAPPVTVTPFDYALYDALAEGHGRQLQYSDRYSESDEESEEEREARESREDRARKARLEKALSVGRSVALFAQASASQAALDAMELSVRMDAYYAAMIDGGSYSDSVVLRDTQLPDSPTGQRNGLAQQLLHQRMVDMQY
jgi:hypothetical protein